MATALVSEVRTSGLYVLKILVSPTRRICRFEARLRIHSRGSNRAEYEPGQARAKNRFLEFIVLAQRKIRHTGSDRLRADGTALTLAEMKIM